MRKYYNRPTEYAGRTYHSKAEANHARYLDLLCGAGRVVSWEAQADIPILVNGIKVCTYRADFAVQWTDGRCEIHEVKGFETKEWMLKKRLLEATWLRDHPEVELVMIRA